MWKEIPNGALLWGSIILGLLLRTWPLLSPPTSSTLWDHHEYVQWGRLMLDKGLTAVYDHPPPEISMWNYRTQQPAKAHRDEQLICNYPPIGVYLIYLEARALDAQTADYISNTPAARRLYAILPVLGDIVTAFGCFSLVRRLTNIRAAHWTFAATFLLPPLILDSTWWTQTDSWVLAPAVWMLSFMTAGWWGWAGFCWGLGLGLKPQSVLLTVVWLFAMVVSPTKRRVLLGIFVSISVFLVSALPFILSGGWSWFENSYVGNLARIYPATTLNAFNIWYLELLYSENADATLRILGISKDVWGKGLLFFATGFGFWWLSRSRSGTAEKLTVFTGVFLLMCVLLPTRVHERYVVLPLPFLTAIVCMGYRRLAWPLLCFILAATLQVTSLQWSPMGPQHWAKIEAQVRTQYEELRSTLPADEFSRLPSPDDQLKVDRIRYTQDRKRLGSPKMEWALTVLSLTSGFSCLGILLFQKPRIGQPTMNNPKQGLPG